MTILTALIILLIALGVVFVVGIWFARHHHAQLNEKLTSLHGKIDVVRGTLDRIKKL